MSPSGPRVGVAALTAAIALAAATIADPAPGAAQGGPRLDLVAQTSWVGAEPAVVDLRIIGDDDDARLEWRLLEAVEDRAELRTVTAEPPAGPRLGVGTIDDLDAARVGAGDVISFTVPDAEIGELLRRDAGALPLVFDLVVDDEVVDTLVTHLLVPGDGPTDAVSIVPLVELDADPGLRPDQQIVVDEDAVDRVAAVASLVSTHAELVPAVALRPELVSTVVAADDRAGLDALGEVAERGELLTEPWVDVDAAAWIAAGLPDVVLDQYGRAAATLDEHLGAATTAVARLRADTDEAALDQLAGIGVDTVIVDGDRLDPPVGPDEGAGPHRLRTRAGTEVAAVVPDEGLARALAGPDPELAAHHTLAEAFTLARGETVPESVLVALDPLPDPAALDVLLEGLATGRHLRLGTLAELGDRDQPAGEGAPARALAVGPTPEPLELAAVDRVLTGERLRAYAAMVAPATAPVAPLDALVATSAHAGFDDATRAAYLDAVDDAVAAGTDGIEVVDGGRITLTSRRADLPLTVVSTEDVPLSVALVFEAEKLDFPEGERRVVVLEPGDNDLVVPVETLASGDARITIDVRSPDDRLPLTDAVVPVRSTAISGLGLLISVAALAVLVVWWFRSWRARRATRASVAETSDPAAGSNGETPPTTGAP